MDRRRIIDDQLYTHLVTFSVERQRRLLDLDHPERIVLGILNHQLEAFKARCISIVLMPNHVHASIRLPATGELSRFMHSWKRMSSFKIRNWYRGDAAGCFSEVDEGDRFRQAKYYSFEIYNEKKRREELGYMYQNPVRSGLVTQAIDWKWSSARWYAGGRTVGVPIQRERNPAFTAGAGQCHVVPATCALATR